jgi:hypothetical protein
MVWIPRSDWDQLKSEIASIKRLAIANHNRVGELMATQQQVRDMIAAINAGVADETTAIGSFELVLSNLNQKITDLTTAAQNADVPQDIVDQLTALQVATGANKQRILDDVQKNTPPAPPAPNP